MKLNLLKKFLCVGSASVAVLFSSCGAVASVEGDELINKARADYKTLDSARVVMTNVDTDEVEQTFMFRYDEKDILMYSYMGVSEQAEYAQYNNGKECFTFDNGEYTHSIKGDKDFNLYNRDMPHPQADEGLILFSPNAVSKATIVEEDGITHITHVYDVDKISAQAEDGKVTAFSAEYFFDGDELLYFIETTDTSNSHHSYRVEIQDKNAVTEIENTVDKYKPD